MAIAKIFKFSSKTIRVVHGPLYEELEIDWEKYTIPDLANILKMCLTPKLLKQSKVFKASDIKKGISVHEGGSHIDIIIDGIGTTDTLSVYDYQL